MKVYILQSRKAEKRGGEAVRREKAEKDTIRPKGCKAFFAEAMRSVNGLSEYMEKHGPHFTPALAETAVSHMWSREDVRSVSWVEVKESVRLHTTKPVPEGLEGDALYVYNMGMFDLAGDVLKGEPDYARYTMRRLDDPDGYDGQVFYHWLTDVMAKGMEIDWKKYV